MSPPYVGHAYPHDELGHGTVIMWEGRLGELRSWDTEKNNWVSIVTTENGRGTELIQVENADAIEAAKLAAKGAGAEVKTADGGSHCFRAKLKPWTDEQKQQARKIAYDKRMTARFAWRANGENKEELELFFVFKYPKTPVIVSEEVLAADWQAADFKGEWKAVDREFQEVVCVQAKDDPAWSA